MVKRALMMGLNYPGTQYQLNGCVNDVKILKDVLMKRYGFEEENMTLLLDTEGAEKPTLDVILKHLHRVVQESQSGDVLFLHYSGHGTQIPDDEKEENDNVDEALVTAEAAPLRDDVLQEALAKLAPGVKFTFIADCCHSGSMLDQPVQQVSGDKGGDAPVAVAGHRDFKHRGLNFSQYKDLAGELAGSFSGGINTDSLSSLLGGQAGSILGGLLNEAPENLPIGSFLGFLKNNKKPARPAQPPANLDSAVLISGCQDNELSADANINGTFNGALTFAVHSILSQTQGNISNKQLCLAAREYLKEQKYDQNPCLSCSNTQVDEPFIDSV